MTDNGDSTDRVAQLELELLRERIAHQTGGFVVHAGRPRRKLDPRRRRRGDRVAG